MTVTIRAVLDDGGTVNASLLSVRDVAEPATPDRVVWVDGSDEGWKPEIPLVGEWFDKIVAMEGSPTGSRRTHR